MNTIFFKYVNTLLNPVYARTKIYVKNNENSLLSLFFVGTLLDHFHHSVHNYTHNKTTTLYTTQIQK